MATPTIPTAALLALLDRAPAPGWSVVYATSSGVVPKRRSFRHFNDAARVAEMLAFQGAVITRRP